MASNADELIYIYIVDSDEFQQKKLRTSFLEAKTNYILRPYTSGEKFMDNLLLNPPPKKALSIVIVDLDLNHNDKQAMNGMNILYKTKELHPEFNIIMVSESNENFENNKIEALNAG
ncbi:MAG: response regulator, partial [Chlorobi bacterium]|nr:response regulator [Chlorobiota bacterium]